MNNHIIDLIKGHQPLNKPIYNLEPVKFEILKTYIKINLVNGFIRVSKSPIGTLIFFVKKRNDKLWLYINYQDLNSLILKNWHYLPLNDKLLRLIRLS